MRAPFPVGVPAEGADPHQDARGLDTVNRLLLHGAHHHDRSVAFLERGSSSWVEMPDWRADRHSIRIGLALGERHGVRSGDVVALSLPLGVRLALAERAVWALGGATLVLDPAGAKRFRGALAGAHPVAILDDEADGERGLSVDGLIDEGGSLDTPERAASFRREARGILGPALASLEPRVDEHGRVRLTERTQADWKSALTTLSHEHPPRRAPRAMLTRRPLEGLRALLYAGWADGLTRTVLAGSDAPRGSVDVLEPSLVIDDDGAGSLATAFATLSRIDD